MSSLGWAGTCPKLVQGIETPSDEVSSQLCAGSSPAQPKETMMRFYTQQHQFYCGIDLHARLLAICIVDQAGAIVLQTQIPADKQLLLQTLAPYRGDVVVCVECLFAWYWVADLCWE